MSKSSVQINEEKKKFKKKIRYEKNLKNILKKDLLKAPTESTEGTEEVVDPKPETKKTLSSLSIAVPGSILENAQSDELRTYLAGQIARAACIFRVDEVVVFDDVGGPEKRPKSQAADQEVRNSSLQLARILQYLECPQYLRKFFFPLHKDLKYSGLLNPLDAPHHLRQQTVSKYREGVVIEKKTKEGSKGCYVNVGLLNDVLVDKYISPGIRVTVRLDNVDGGAKKLRGKVVSPTEPQESMGIYWGYSVRIAKTLSDVFTKSSYEGGYDLIIGTSDKGADVNALEPKSLKYRHALIVFGGLSGLEAAIEMDDNFNTEDPETLFEHYLNVLPLQGTRTIRTEEAILIALSSLKQKLSPKDVE